jgi:hypothetical protein
VLFVSVNQCCLLLAISVVCYYQSVLFVSVNQCCLLVVNSVVYLELT